MKNRLDRVHEIFLSPLVEANAQERTEKKLDQISNLCQQHTLQYVWKASHSAYSFNW